MRACQHCHRSLEEADDWVHVTMQSIVRHATQATITSRSPVDFCNAHCLADWSRYIADEADRRIAQAKN